MKVSVALCTYNGEKFLAEQLDSILAQTLLPNEIILSDDSSTDGTLEIGRRYRDNNSHIELIIHSNKERLGVLRNFEQAINATSGDFIFLCDQDDVWHPNKTSDLVATLQSRPDKDVVFSNADLIGLREGSLWEFVRFNDHVRNDWRKHGSLYAFMRYKSICTGASMAFKKGAKKYLLPFHEAPYSIHDGWIGMAAAVRDRIFFEDKKLYHYRIHDQQWTQHNTGKTDASKKEDLIMKTNFIHYFIDFYKIDDKEIVDLYHHYVWRKELSGSFYKKLFPICKEALRGKYNRYSNGLISAARDLLF